MASNRIYLDACCIIEAIKGRLGRSTQHDSDEVDMIHRILRASRDGEISVVTSMLSVAEVLYVDKTERPPSDETKALINRFLMSGRDGVRLIAPSPMIAMKARDLAWSQKIFTRSIDLLHVATAIEAQASELITLDGRLARKLGRSSIDGVALISAKATALLPDEYKTDDLFKEP